MSTISDLPVELFSYVFGLLAPEDLKTVTLVCQKWKGIAYEPKLWTWAVVKIYSMGDLQKLEIPQLEQIKAIRLGPPNYCLLNLGDERNWSKAELEDVFDAIARKVIPVKKLSVHVWRLTRLNPTVVASAASNVKELELYHLSVDQVKTLLREIVENEGPLTKLKILFRIDVSGLFGIDADLISRAFNRLEEVELIGGHGLRSGQVQAILKGVVEEGSKLKRMWLDILRDTKMRVDRELVRNAEKRIGKFC